MDNKPVTDCKHEWMVAPHFDTVRSYSPEVSSDTHKQLIRAITYMFTADEVFVQLKCRLCSKYAAARNQLPIVGPVNEEPLRFMSYWIDTTEGDF